MDGPLGGMVRSGPVRMPMSGESAHLCSVKGVLIDRIGPPWRSSFAYHNEPDRVLVRNRRLALCVASAVSCTSMERGQLSRL
jgi:hypothetical protein